MSAGARTVAALRRHLIDDVMEEVYALVVASAQRAAPRAAVVAIDGDWAFFVEAAVHACAVQTSPSHVCCLRLHVRGLRRSG